MIQHDLELFGGAQDKDEARLLLKGEGPEPQIPESRELPTRLAGWRGEEGERRRVRVGRSSRVWK